MLTTDGPVEGASTYSAVGSTAVSTLGVASTIDPLATRRAASSAAVAAASARASSMLPTAVASGAGGSPVSPPAPAPAFAAASARWVAASCARRASAPCCADTTNIENQSTRSTSPTIIAMARAANGVRRRVRGTCAATIRKASSIPPQVSDDRCPGCSSGRCGPGRRRRLKRHHAGARRAGAVGHAGNRDVRVEASAGGRGDRVPNVRGRARHADGVGIGGGAGRVSERRLEPLQGLGRPLRVGTAGREPLDGSDRLLAGRLRLDILGGADLTHLAVRRLVAGARHEVHEAPDEKRGHDDADPAQDVSRPLDPAAGSRAWGAGRRVLGAPRPVPMLGRLSEGEGVVHPRRYRYRRAATEPPG